MNETSLDISPRLGVISIVLQTIDPDVILVDDKLDTDPVEAIKLLVEIDVELRFVTVPDGELRSVTTCKVPIVELTDDTFVIFALGA